MVGERMTLRWEDHAQPTTEDHEDGVLEQQIAHKHIQSQSKSIDDGSMFEKLATQSIAPFMTKNVAAQYAPIGKQETASQPNSNNSSTKYCYRHHPDLKCKKQADEKSMEQLQSELGSLPEAQQAGIANVWTLFAAAPAKHRDLMLQGILSQCCSPQLSQISSVVRELVKIDFLSVLPAELGLRVLTFLDPTSICRAAQVSRRWRQLADDDVVWHTMCEQHIDRKCAKCGIGLPLLDQKRLRSEKRQIQLRANGLHGLDGEAPNRLVQTPPVANPTQAVTGTKRAHDSAVESDSSSKRPCIKSESQDDYFDEQSGKKPWKDVYRERHRISSNWNHGRYSARQYHGHTNGVMCLQFDDKILATGSYDSTIKIWNAETGEELRTLKGHTDGLRCLHFHGSILVSGSLDHTIRVWDINTGTCIRTLTGHTGPVVGLTFEGPYVVSGSADKTIRLWNLKQPQTHITIQGHTDWVNTVKLDLASRTLLSSSDDGTVRLWCLDTRRCIQTFSGHVAPVQSAIFMPREFELEDEQGEHSDQSDGKVVPWSWSRHESKSPSPSSSSNGTAASQRVRRSSPPRYILTGSLDSTLRLWDSWTGESVKTFFGHLEGVWAIAADTLRIVSGAHDGMTKIWDPRTGKCERTIAKHRGPVAAVGLSDRRMCTGGEDHEVWLYSFCA